MRKSYDQLEQDADDDVSEFGTAECLAALREGRRPGEVKFKEENDTWTAF